MHESLGSTNAVALAADGPAWIMAQVQTAGRGRRARGWASPRGNLHTSLILHPEGPPQRMALRSFAAALALRDAILTAYAVPAGAEHGRAQILDVTLKWPNDVLVSGCKVAGILLESSPRGALPCLAIGFGVNLLHAPDASMIEAGATPATSLQAQTGQTLEPQVFLTHLAAAYALREAQIAAKGFAPIRADFLAHAARLGTPITARLADGTAHTGQYETIDTDGNLILITAAARKVIPAADVFF